eukprot:TRINITY_DN7350_c0_g1_i1.p1 TRINITY_DN7350_c0_g1~~TRINITY_DN7350_c0_g1_i1.p1  ORF type:complete len:103 (-),score=12.21 TRINITY_DN7350_c0_g1_i1:4-312(-)
MDLDSKLKNPSTPLKQIAKGFSGSIVSLEVDGHERAVKILQFNPLDNRIEQEFLREVKVLQTCKHPNVIPYYGANLTTDTGYIVLERAHSCLLYTSPSPRDS